MSLFFITGVSGAGKSTAVLELRSRGYRAYDTDDDGLARWQNIETGYIHPKSSVHAHQRTTEFLQTHLWNVPRQILEDKVGNIHDESVFVCGVANNMDEIRDLFAGVFALVVDEDTLRYRIANRTNNDWGKQPHELEQVLARHRKSLEVYNRLGYTIIDASQPIGQVIDGILQQSQRA